MEEYGDEGTFHAEIEVLTKIRHRSMVKLYGFCSHSQCKFLVYDLIERGSLESILHEQELVEEVDWPKRIAIVTDVAQALSYLHHDCEDPIVHRDIKNSNILLDLDYKAYISDFGMARKLKHGYSSWSTIFAGTCGYIAPVLVSLRWKLLWESTQGINFFRSFAEQSNQESSRTSSIDASQHRQLSKKRRLSFLLLWWPLLACKSTQKPGRQCSRYIECSQVEVAQRSCSGPFMKSGCKIGMIIVAA